MKFGNALQNVSRYFPEQRFLTYNQLKKILKAVASPITLGPAKKEHDKETNPLICVDLKEGEVVDGKLFMKRLHQEIHELNEYFMDEEESLVIRFEDLQTALKTAKAEEKMKYFASVVQFRGDVVSLLNWVVLNLAAVAKILKKHDKLMPEQPIRQSFLPFALQQPFFSTELLARLERQCDEMLEEMNLLTATSAEEDEHRPSMICPEEVLQDMGTPFSLTKMLYAIQTWKDLGNNAHTPSTVLPSSELLYSADLEETERSSTAAQKKRPIPEEEVPPTSTKIARVSE